MSARTRSSACRWRWRPASAATGPRPTEGRPGGRCPPGPPVGALRPSRGSRGAEPPLPSWDQPWLPAPLPRLIATKTVWPSCRTRSATAPPLCSAAWIAFSASCTEVIGVCADADDDVAGLDAGGRRRRVRRHLRHDCAPRAGGQVELALSVRRHRLEHQAELRVARARRRVRRRHVVGQGRQRHGQVGGVAVVDHPGMRGVAGLDGGDVHREIARALDRLPSTAVITSPACRPACSAGVPDWTEAISAPSALGRCSACCMAGVIGCASTPR